MQGKRECLSCCGVVSGVDAAVRAHVRVAAVRKLAVRERLLVLLSERFHSRAIPTLLAKRLCSCSTYGANKRKTLEGKRSSADKHVTMFRLQLNSNHFGEGPCNKAPSDEV